MATQPDIKITLSLEEAELLRDFTRLAQRLEARAKTSQDALTKIQDVGEAKRVESQKTFAVKTEQAETTHQAKMRRTQETNLQRQILAQQKAQTKMLANQNSWSRKMTAGLSSLVMGMKSFAIAYATMFVGQAIRGAITFAGDLGDTAELLQITTREVYALQEALIDTGVPSAKLETLFAKLNSILANPSDAQLSTIRRLGIDANSATANIDLLNALMNDTAAASDLLGPKLIMVVNGLKQFGSVGGAVNKFSLPISDEDVKTLDAYGAKMQLLTRTIQLSIAKALASPGVNKNFNTFMDEIIAKIKTIDFTAVINGIIKILELLGKFGTQGGPQAVVSVKALSESYASTFTNIMKTVKALSEARTALLVLAEGERGYANVTKQVEALTKATAGIEIVPPKVQEDLLALKMQQDKLGAQAIEGSVAYRKLEQNLGLFGKTIYKAYIATKGFSDGMLTAGKAVLKFFSFLAPVFKVIGKISIWLAAIFVIWDFIKAVTAGNNILVALLYSLGKFVTSILDLVGLIGSFIPGWNAFWSAPGKWLDDWVLGNKEIEKTKENLEFISKLQAPAFGAKPGTSLGFTYFITPEEMQKLIEEQKRVNQFQATIDKYLSDAKTEVDRINQLLVDQDALQSLIKEAAKGSVEWKFYTDALAKVNEELENYAAVNNAIAIIPDAVSNRLLKNIKLSKEMRDAFRDMMAEVRKPIPQTGVGFEGYDFIRNFQDASLAIWNEKRQLERALNIASSEDGGMFGDMFLSKEDVPKIKARLNELNAPLEATINALGLNAQQTEVFQKYVDIVAEGITFIGSLWAQNAQNELTAHANRMAMQQEYLDLLRSEWQERSDNLTKAGLANSIYYRNETRAFKTMEKAKEAELERLKKQENELKSKEWEAQRNASILNIASTLGQAILAAFTFIPPQPHLTTAMIIAASASAAMQTAMLASQKNPYAGFAMGGLIPGQGTADQTLVRTTPGEYIVNRRSTADNFELLEAINRGRNVNTQAPITVHIHGDVLGTQDFVDNKLSPLIERSIRNGYLKTSK